MVTFNPKLSVSAGLDHLAERLGPIIAARLAGDLGGLPWTTVLDQLDSIAGRPAKHYSPNDLQPQLKMFTKRLGGLGFPFDDVRQTVGTLGRELTIVRNARAHGDSFTALDAWRAHDYCVRLLEHFADAEGLIRAHELRQEALAAYIAEEGFAPVPVPSSPEPESTSAGAGLAAGATGGGEHVTPDAAVYKRVTTEPSAKVVGGDRLDFEPWVPVPVGDVSVLDDLPKKVAKEKVRAVAVEIVDAEGPIHLDRLASLVGASFGVQRLYAARAKRSFTRHAPQASISTPTSSHGPTESTRRSGPSSARTPRMLTAPSSRSVPSRSPTRCASCASRHPNSPTTSSKWRPSRHSAASDVRHKSLLTFG